MPEGQGRGGSAEEAAPGDARFQLETALNAEMPGRIAELDPCDGVAVAVRDILANGGRRIDGQAVRQKNGVVRARREPQNVRREKDPRRIAVMCFVTDQKAHLRPFE